MKYIVVKTYGNGKYMSKVYPMWFEWLSQAQRICDELNTQDDDGDKWISMPIIQYVGKVW
jgi:hypothetical protein